MWLDGGDLGQAEAVRKLARDMTLYDGFGFAQGLRGSRAQPKCLGRASRRRPRRALRRDRPLPLRSRIRTRGRDEYKRPDERDPAQRSTTHDYVTQPTTERFGARWLPCHW